MDGVTRNEKGMSKIASPNRFQLVLPDLDETAKRTELIIRESSKFSATSFLQVLLGAVVTGLASLNQLVIALKEKGLKGMARQSLFDRFGTHSTAFFMSILSDLMEQRYRPLVSVIGSSGIERVLIEDATSQVMPKSNAKEFPAHGNYYGNTAGVKIDFAFDLLAGNIISHSLHGANTQDKTIGKEFVVEVKMNDLVLRDMGYFSLDEFTAIEEVGAFWLTRLPLTTDVSFALGSDFELESELPLKKRKSLEKQLKKTKGNVIDIEVSVGKQGKKCRLVAIRAEKKVVAKRRAERRKKAKDLGKNPCPKGLIRDGWHLMLTSLSRTQANVSQIAAIYCARWAVEIQFRAWKQALNLKKALNRKSNEHHMFAIILSGMIAHQLGMKIAQKLGEVFGRMNLSYERIYDHLAILLNTTKNLEELFAYSPDKRHVTRDKKASKSPIELGILALA